MKGFLDPLNQPLKLPKLSQPLKLPKLPFGLSGGRGGKTSPTAGAAAAVLPVGGVTPPLDLLRERREELELEPLSGLLVQRPVLLRRGLIWGGLVVGANLGLCGVLVLWQQMLKARMAELETYEVQVQQLSQELMGHRAALKAVKEGNDQLVKRLTDVRSSSALLADLQLRVPEGVQITAVQMEGTNAIKLEGVAREPMAFGRVNAMELVLRQSPLIAATGVTLGKVERVPAQQLAIQAAGPAKPGAPQQRLELPSAVSFAMSATLTPLAANRLVAVMEGLQADGMVRRLELLQREGLLK
jgi:type IV pilus assembly protein PilN